MSPARMTKLKVPTDAQMAARLDELVAAHKQREDDVLRCRYEAQARAELAEELNRDYFDALLADQLEDAGYTFVRDVWPTHPAAGHVVGHAVGGRVANRPCGVRRPFRLAKDGIWFCDYWVCSPLYPAGRLPEGGIIVGFQTGDLWRLSSVSPPARNYLDGSTADGFEDLVSFGLRLNPQRLIGRPERPAEQPGEVVYGDPRILGDSMIFGGIGSNTDDDTTRTSSDLLWRFINATQNDAPWEVPAAS